MPLTGQGIAWDHRQPGMLDGIDRARQQVIAMQIAASVTLAPLHLAGR